MPCLQPDPPREEPPVTLQEKLLMRVFLHGHSNGKMPRWFRRVFARSAIHRAWLVGHDGCFWQHGVRFGPANPYVEHMHGINTELAETMRVEEQFPELGEP